MLNANDVKQLREKGMSNMDILKNMARVVPSAAQALSDIEADTSTPQWQRETLVGKMLDKAVPANAPSGMAYMNKIMMDEAQKKYDSHVTKLDETTKQQKLAQSFEAPGDPLGRIVGGVTRLGEYIASPLATASGLIQKGLGAEQSADVRELPQQAAMARTSLPLTVGLATAPLSLPAAAAATGLAGAAGRGLKEASDATTGVDQQTVGQRVKESLTEGAIVGATDFAFGKAGQLLGKFGKKLLSPLAGRFNQEIATLAQKKGINLPLSSVSDSNIVKQAEALSQKGIFGGKLETVVDTANKKLSSISDDFVKKFGGTEDLTIAGKSVIEGADTFRDSWRALKNKAYQTANELLQKGDAGSFMPNTSNTVRVIDEILSSKQAASGIIGEAATSDTTTAILQTIRKNLTSGETKSLSAFTSALDELNKMTKFGNTLISTGDQAILKKVIATMDQDVTNGLRSIAPKAARALDKADEIYKKGIELLDSSFGDKIAKLSDNPTKIVDQLLTPKSVDDVPRIFELIGKGKNGPQRIADVRSAFARKLLDKATGERGIMGRTLDNVIDSYGESTVRAILGEDGLQAIREIQKLASAINAGQKVAEGSQTAFLGKIQAFLTALFTGNLPIAASIAGGDRVLSGLFQTQWFRNWLTKGFQASPLLEGAANVAGEAMQRAGVGLVQQFTDE